ncbi:MAG: type III pantothenate kinase [Paludibacter sp.]
MNLCIDRGNSSTKIGIFKENKLVEASVFNNFGLNEITNLFIKFPIEASILSSVVENNDEIIRELKSKSKYFVELTHETALPITNLYETPETLGKDRIAVVVGANFLKSDSDLLVIDAGTAITYDFINHKNEYLGGNIAPGLHMRLQAMHHFTSKLPLVEAEFESPFFGTDTKSAILAGAFQGIIFEIDGYINSLKIKYLQLSTFLTGGSTFYFANKLKNTIFAEKNLVLIGLNRILEYNVQN